MAYFVLGLGLLLGGILFMRWFVQADPKTLAKGIVWAASIVGGLLVIYLLATGRLAHALGALVFFVPLLSRFRAMRGMWRHWKSASGPTPGRTSDVETAFLRMRLDHDTGRISGAVIAGTYRGRRLEELALPQILDLLGECQAADPQSAQVLESYLDREYADWRETGPHAEGAGGGSGGGAAPTSPMTREEAYAVLGLEPGASDEEVKEAHRRLMRQLHPDHGGTNYLAAKINEAKALLLGER